MYRDPITLKNCLACASDRLFIAEATLLEKFRGQYVIPRNRSLIEHLVEDDAIKFNAVICLYCGFYHWFVKPENFEKIIKSKYFKPL